MNGEYGFRGTYTGVNIAMRNGYLSNNSSSTTDSSSSKSEEKMGVFCLSKKTSTLVEQLKRKPKMQDVEEIEKDVCCLDAWVGYNVKPGITLSSAGNLDNRMLYYPSKEDSEHLEKVTVRVNDLLKSKIAISGEGPLITSQEVLFRLASLSPCADSSARGFQEMRTTAESRNTKNLAEYCIEKQRENIAFNQKFSSPSSLKRRLEQLHEAEDNVIAKCRKLYDKGFSGMNKARAKILYNSALVDIASEVSKSDKKRIIELWKILDRRGDRVDQVATAFILEKLEDPNVVYPIRGYFSNQIAEVISDFEAPLRENRSKSIRKTTHK